MIDQIQLHWTAETIIEFLQEHRQLLRDMRVQRIGLFGSYVRGEQRPDSDIDLIFVMDKIDFAGWMDVWNYLERELELKIDLVPEKDLRKEIRDQVLDEVVYVEIA